MSKKIITTFSWGGIGLLISFIAFLTQENDYSIYLIGAPYYIDIMTIRSGHYVSIINFLYFTIIFSFVGYLFTAGLKKLYLTVAIVAIFTMHCSLMYLGGKEISDGLFSTLHELSKEGIEINR